MGQQYAPKPTEESTPRFAARSAESPPTQASIAETTSTRIEAPTQAAAESSKPADQQLESLWEGFRRKHRFERLSALLSRLGVASIAGSIATALASLPHSPPVRACIDVAMRYPTPFRLGFAIVAAGLLGVGLFLLSDAAKRLFF